MALKKSKPYTPSRRFTELSGGEDLTDKRPERRLLAHKKRGSGRNSQGRITVRHRGGGHKRHVRLVDFRREKRDIPARVAAIEYDPNRSARLALLHYRDGEKRYILAPEGLRPGQEVVAGERVEPSVGNALPLARIPLGMPVHCVELRPGAGAQIARAAGQVVQLMAREGGFANLKLPSGEIRRVRESCYATVGQVGNAEHESISLGKAGRKRWLGIRPTVRGVAMNPIDHPMGGGEGRSSGGGHPVSPWGQLAKGRRTRARNKGSGKFIIKRRA